MEKEPRKRDEGLDALREPAEAILRRTRTDIARMPVADIQALVHELQVHQVELEIQNEELRETQIRLAESRDRYADLYEFAPVGYLTLDRHGNIHEANRAAATLLGVERTELRGVNLTRFIVRTAQDDFYRYCREVFETDTHHACTLDLRDAKGKRRTVQLESITLGSGDAPRTMCLTAMIDLTDRVCAENALQQLNASLEQRIAERTADLDETNRQLRDEVQRRRKFERIARQTETKYRLLVENVPAITYVATVESMRTRSGRFSRSCTQPRRKSQIMPRE